MLVKLYQALKENPSLNLYVLPLTTATNYCESNEVSNYLRLEDQISLLGLSNIERNFADSIVQGLSFSGSVSKEHSKAYHQIGLIDLYRMEGPDKALQQFNQFGRKAFNPVLFAKSLLKKLDIDTVITTNVPRYERAFIRAGNDLGLKTISIDDLVGLPLEALESEICFVDNELAKVNLLKQDYKGKVVITGNPIFDFSRSLMAKRGASDNSLLVLLQTGIRNIETGELIEFSDNFYYNFFSQFEKIPGVSDYDISVRFHPSMAKKVYWQNANISIDESASMEDSLINHTYALGFTSTSIYEAYLAGCKTMTLSFPQRYFRLPMEYIGEISLEGDIDIPNLQFRKRSHAGIEKQNSIQNMINEILHN